MLQRKDGVGDRGEDYVVNKDSKASCPKKVAHKNQQASPRYQSP